MPAAPTTPVPLPPGPVTKCGTRDTPPCPPGDDAVVALEDYRDGVIAIAVQQASTAATAAAYAQIAEIIDRTRALVKQERYTPVEDQPDKPSQRVFEALERLIDVLPLTEASSEEEALRRRRAHARAWLAGVIGNLQALGAQWKP